MALDKFSPLAGLGAPGGEGSGLLGRGWAFRAPALEGPLSDGTRSLGLSSARPARPARASVPAGRLPRARRDTFKKTSWKEAGACPDVPDVPRPAAARLGLDSKGGFS